MTEIPDFQILFKNALAKCKAVYEKHQLKKGDSWKKSSLEFLRHKLVEEFKEWDVAFSHEDELSETIDIVNISLMLIERIIDYYRASTNIWINPLTKVIVISNTNKVTRIRPQAKDPLLRAFGNLGYIMFLMFWWLIPEG